VNPKSCKTDGVWGANPLATREITREELEEEKVIDIKARESFYVFYDRDLRLRDLLEEKGIKCEEVKKLRLQIETKWFILREVSLKVVKK
jgi:DNA-binding Xre family transcriptional regulator